MVGLEYLDFDIISSTRVYYICNMSNVVNQNLLDRDPAKPVEDTGEKDDEENIIVAITRVIQIPYQVHISRKREIVPIISEIS